MPQSTAWAKPAANTSVTAAVIVSRFSSITPPMRRSGMGAHPRTAVSLDALGTLVELEPPAPRLVRALAERGVEVTEDAAERAFAAEIAYYLEHHLEGSRRGGAGRACATGVRRCSETSLGLTDVREPMLEALRFRAFPDAAPALEELRARGLALVVVSNWDCSLPAVLDEAGLLGLVDGVVSSAEAGAAKPDPAPFRAGLELIGARPVRGAARGGLAGEGRGGRARRGHGGGADRQGGRRRHPLARRAAPPNLSPVEASTDTARERAAPAGRGASAFAAFAVALLVTFLFAGIAAAVGGVEPGEEQPASFTIIATGIQDTALVASAVFFAALVARPRAWHFGLRRTAFWPAVGWAALGLVCFYLFAAIYGAIVQPDQAGHHREPGRRPGHASG